MGGFQAQWAAIVGLVDEQADDEGCWFIAETAPEAYLQQELRRLHAAIESATPPVAAIGARAGFDPMLYGRRSDEQRSVL